MTYLTLLTTTRLQPGRTSSKGSIIGIINHCHYMRHFYMLANNGAGRQEMESPTETTEADSIVCFFAVIAWFVSFL